MPTPESAEVFARLVAARARLTDITRLLNESHARLLSEGKAGRQRHAELQAEWEEAFRTFEEATGEFSTIVKKLHQDVEEQRLPKPDSN
jgi:hypothetical protein